MIKAEKLKDLIRLCPPLTGKTLSRLKEVEENDGDQVIGPYQPINHAISSSVSRKRRRTISVAVFSGGSGSTISLFNEALDEFRRQHDDIRISVEYNTNKTVRENESGHLTSPDDLVTWLESKSAYFIVSQGIWLGMVSSGANSDGWNTKFIKKALARLQDEGHGYPSGSQLLCPIWNGDKLRYLNLIPDFAIPTMEVNLFELSKASYSDVIEQIRL